MKAVHSFTASGGGKGVRGRKGRRGKDQPGRDQMAEEKSFSFFFLEITGELEGKDWS